MFEIHDVEKNLNDELMEYFKGEKDGYVQIGPKKWFLPKKYEKFSEDYKNFEVRPDDVWVIGSPRSGTTVTQDLVWLLTHNLDYEGAKEFVMERVPFFEHNIVFNDKSVEEKLKNCSDPNVKKMIDLASSSLKRLIEKKDRRVIKTHLPLELLPKDVFTKGCKIVYVCRYPKDVGVSYFNLQKQLWQINFIGDFQKYWHFFQNGLTMFGPYFEHVKQAYELKDHKNLHFVFFEDLRKDLGKFIDDLSKFLEIPLTEDEHKTLKEYFQFDNYKKNSISKETVKNKDNETIVRARKGKVGGWEDYFIDDEMNKKADQWIQENIEEIGINYPTNN